MVYKTGKMSRHQYLAFTFVHLRNAFRLVVQRYISGWHSKSSIFPSVRKGFTWLGFPQLPRNSQVILFWGHTTQNFKGHYIFHTEHCLPSTCKQNWLVHPSHLIFVIKHKILKKKVISKHLNLKPERKEIMKSSIFTPGTRKWSKTHRARLRGGSAHTICHRSRKTWLLGLTGQPVETISKFLGSGWDPVSKIR